LKAKHLNIRLQFQ